MIKAQVLTTWSETAEGNTPALNLQPGDSAMDVTGQANVEAPNLVVWELWCGEIAPYEADNSIDILWWEEIPDAEE